MPRPGRSMLIQKAFLYQRTAIITCLT